MPNKAADQELKAPDQELDAYLRLNRASPREWLVALRALSGWDGVECRLGTGGGTAGALSALTSGLGRVVCIHASQDMEITGRSAPGPVLLLPRAGDPAISRQDKPWQPMLHLMAARSSDRFRLRLPRNGRVMILRPAAGIPDSLIRDEGGKRLADCQDLITAYLLNSPFFRDDAHARELTDDLFRQLAATASNEGAPPRRRPGLDRRIVRMIEKIRQEPAWDFNLRELASHSGVSERNLYYLMKRETGTTPYRFYQRNRLIRVRRRLVDCQCEVPHISWYAADEGFSHLGRFAALYREHFGELPSETVQWRRSLRHRKPVSAPALALDRIPERQ